MGPLTTAALAALLTSMARGGPLPEPPAGSKRWIVVFRPDVKRAGRDAALAALDVRAEAHIATEGNSDKEFSAAVVDLPEGRRLEKPWADGDIVSVEADRRVKWIEQVPGFAAAKSLARRPELTWGVGRVHAPAAWPVTEGAGVKVAVIDTGIDLGNADLQEKVDGGYSALAQTERPQDYQDDNGHGTHVAGIIAAARDGKGVVGVAPKARLYAVKVLDAEGRGSLSEVIDGLVWAAKNGMQVANMSLGAQIDSEALHRAVRAAKDLGVVIVAAAGNSGDSDGAVRYPGAYPETIAVAASDERDRPAGFSSRGPEVKFVAPGVDVVSDNLGGGLISRSGASMSAPHVAGLAALAISLDWTGLYGPDGVYEQLKNAAKPLPLLAAEQQGWGMIDAGKLAR